MRADGDAVAQAGMRLRLWRSQRSGRVKPSRVDGSGLQVVQAGVGFDVQLQALRIGNQQATAFQHPHDAAAEGIIDIQADVDYLLLRRRLRVCFVIGALKLTNLRYPSVTVVSNSTTKHACGRQSQ
jgi:hypothetical protein